MQLQKKKQDQTNFFEIHLTLLHIFYVLFHSDTWMSLGGTRTSNYSNSTHGRLITMILIAFSLLSIVLFAIFSVLILTGIKIVLKLYSRQHNKIYSSISGILINSCSFFCNTALSGNCSLYSATIIGDKVLLIAYSTTSSSLEAQRIIPTLGFSFSFFF